MADSSNEAPVSASALQQALKALSTAEAHLKMLLGNGAPAYNRLSFGLEINSAQHRLRNEIAKSAPHYPLPDELYAGSKDWLDGGYAQRVEWLHVMYEGAKQERDRYLEQFARYHWLCSHLTQIHVETSQPAGSPADSPMRVTLIQAWPGLPRTDAASVDAAVVEAMKEGA